MRIYLGKRGGGVGRATLLLMIVNMGMKPEASDSKYVSVVL